MTENNEVSSLGLFKEHKKEILDRWLKELTENPRFSGKDVAHNKNLVASSKDFFANILKTMETSEIPDCSPKTFEPILKFWHNSMQEQMQKGFTVKDTAMLIFSLKASIIAFVKEYYSKEGYSYTPELNKLGNLLDLLGVLTFEIYTAEKERLISRQSEQINYLQSHKEFGDLIGNSQAMKAVYQAIGLILENDISVLLQGESGTGKDLIANIIHKNSKRKHKPLVTLNCGAIPKELIESELFGHEKGAFTGAELKRIGKFELAHGGTLFLDEVGELSSDAQVKLLRAIQNKEIERVGGSDKVKVDVRIIAATNRDLQKAVDEGDFRLDLYYRLNVYPLLIPPLKDRLEDIIPLAYYFLEYYAKQFQINASVIEADAKQYLLSQQWPGNVRELENLMQRAVVISQGSPISSAMLSMTPGKHPLVAFESEKKLLTVADNNEDGLLTLDEVEKRTIEKTILAKKGNIKQAAKILGISRTTFYAKLKKYGIEFDA
jgi:transcriptional regulator with GAF, ATPase, and Fis domain